MKALVFLKKCCCTKSFHHNHYNLLVYICAVFRWRTLNMILPVRGDRPNEWQPAHPGLDNPVWDQAVTSGWRAAPAQPIRRCTAAVCPAVPLSLTETTRTSSSSSSSAPLRVPYSCLCFVPKTDLLPTYCGKVSVFNCGSGGVIRLELEENRRRGEGEKVRPSSIASEAGKKKDASVCHNGEDAASAFKRCFTFLTAMLSYDELLFSVLRGKWFSSVSGVVQFFLYFCYLFIAVAQR